MCTIFEKGKTLYEKQATLLCLTFSAPMQINLEVTLLEPICLPAPPLSGMAVTASLSSHVMLNQHLLEAVMGKSPSLRVVFSAYKDFTCILLCPSESGVYKFPKSGRIKDIAFSRSPVEAGSPCRPATRRRGIPHTADRWACWIR